MRILRYIYFIYLWKEGKAGRKMGREASMWERNTDQLPELGTRLQPRHLPGLGIEPVTLCFAGQLPTNWATSVKAVTRTFKICSLSNFQMYTTVLFTIITILYITSPWLNSFYNKKFVLLTTFTHSWRWLLLWVWPEICICVLSFLPFRLGRFLLRNRSHPQHLLNMPPELLLLGSPLLSVWGHVKVMAGISHSGSISQSSCNPSPYSRTETNAKSCISAMIIITLLHSSQLSRLEWYGF